MGYTHYFEQQRAATEEEWGNITRDFRALYESGLAPCIQYEENLAEPPLINGLEIRFNGAGSDGHETMVLERDGRGFQFCKTRGAPYDAAVTALLTLCRYHAPEVWNIRSGGHWGRLARRYRPGPKGSNPQRKERTMKTILHTYKYDIRNPEEAQQYAELCDRLKTQGLKCFESWGPGEGHYSFVKVLDGKEIELETKHLFDNQWNTAPESGNKRVFDWAQDYMPDGYNKSLKRGHYLEQTEEMREIRRTQVKCGYCGHQETASDKEFCGQCFGSPYLEKHQLHLTRLKKISDTSGRAPLTEAELADLLPRYAEEQSKLRRKQQAKARQKLIDDAEKAIRIEETKRDGMLWLLDHGINLDNCIYYSHTGKFSFGWRQPVAPEVAEEIRQKIEGFPFDFEIKEG